MFRLTPRRGSMWLCASLGGNSDFSADAPDPDWPLAAHSAPAPAPAATPASAAACFRNRLRPEPLDSMIASCDPEFPIELCIGPVFASRTAKDRRLGPRGLRQTTLQ